MRHESGEPNKIGGGPNADAVLRDLALSFVSTPTERIDGAIADAQKRLIEFLGIERSLVIELEDTTRSWVITDSGAAFSGESAGACFKPSCGVCRKILRGEEIRLPSGGDRGPEAAQEAEANCGLSYGAVLGLPLADGQRVFGALVFALSREPRPWPDLLVAQLRFSAEIFARALSRKRTERAQSRQAAPNGLAETQESLRTALAEVDRLRNRVPKQNGPGQKARPQHAGRRIVGHSAAIQRVLGGADQVARTDTTVLLLGETGTGKELVATMIHELSARRGRALVSVNCAAMPAALVESELFGREKGAFTGSLSRQVGRFELANDSTIFLDEVGDLSPEIQAKLLRVLETKQIERLGNPRPVPVNVRVIAATNRDLEKAVGEGKFRQDLYYRLNVFPLLLPPLRERREDIEPLVWAFVDEFAETFNKNIKSIEQESLDALQHYSWPGNIRELRNLIERAMIIATGPKLRIQLPLTLTPSVSANVRKLEEVEREHVLNILEKSGWRVRGMHGAAERLGLKPTTLEARMAKLGIRRPSLVENRESL